MSHGSQPGVVLSFTPEFDVVRDTEVRLTFNLHLQAREMSTEGAEGEGRSVVSLSCVLDKSGSMSGDKLDLVKRASEFMIAQLGSRDKLGLVEYDSHVNEVIPLSKTSAAFKAESKRMVSTIEAGSCTNLSGGLFQGIQQQIDNVYIDWDTGEASPPAPTAPSAPPSDTSSVLNHRHLDDVSDTQSIASITIPAAVPLRSGLASAITGLWGRMTRHAPHPSSQHTNMRPHAFSHGPRPDQGFFFIDPHERVALFGGRAVPAKQDVEEDAVRSVFVFTDGQANEGVTDEAKLVSMVRKMVDGKKRVRVYTFGFGDDHSEELLSKLAEAGSGSYYFIEKEDNIATAFADALGGLLSVAAQNLKLTFVPAPGVVVDDVHTSFTKSEESGGATSVRIGDMLSEESKDTLIDVRLPALTNLAQGETVHYKIGHVEVTYLDVNTASTTRLQVDCIVKRSCQVATDGSNRSVSVQRARIDMVQTLEQSRTYADAGNYEASRECLAVCAKRLKALVESSSAANDAVSAGLTQVLCDDVAQALADTSTETVWRSKGKKKMNMKISSRSAQRAVVCGDEEDELIEKLMCLESAEGMKREAAGAPSPFSSVSQFSSGNQMQQRMRMMSKSFSALH